MQTENLVGGGLFFRVFGELVCNEGKLIAQLQSNVEKE